MTTTFPALSGKKVPAEIGKPPILRETYSRRNQSGLIGIPATSTMIAVMERMATYSGKEITWEDAISKGKTLFPYDKELSYDGDAPVMPGPDRTYEHDVAMPGKYDPFE